MFEHYVLLCRDVSRPKVERGKKEDLVQLQNICIYEKKIDFRVILIIPPLRCTCKHGYGQERQNLANSLLREILVDTYEAHQIERVISIHSRFYGSWPKEDNGVVMAGNRENPFHCFCIMINIVKRDITSPLSQFTTKNLIPSKI